MSAAASSVRVVDDPAALAGGGPVHLAIGMFDGVHRGHAAVLGSAVEAARRDGGVAAVLTFHPHPSRILRPSEAVPLLLDPEEKAARLAAHGIAAVVQVPFTPAFAAREAADFGPWLAARLPSLAGIHVGANFRFGRGRAGDASVLGSFADATGRAFRAVPRADAGGEPISSTRLRALVAGGDLAAANALLGAPYACRGRVVDGRHLGRTIGFPTVNLDWSPELEPAHGVYAVRFGRPEAPARDGVANFGVRPTVAGGDARPVLEIHDLAGDPGLAVGDPVRVAWIARLRGERRFPSLDALRAAIAADAESARALLAAEPR